MFPTFDAICSSSLIRIRILRLTRETIGLVESSCLMPCSEQAVDTPSLRRALGKSAGPEAVNQIVQSMAQKSPLGRIGEAREIG